MLISTILQHFPDHLVYGEERGWRPEKKLADFVWVIDPIDGTKSFKHGIPTFGILVALLYKNKPILGIIDQPIIHRRWLGVHGRTTKDNEGSVCTRSCEHLSRTILYTSSPLHFSYEEKEAFDRASDKVQEPLYGAECITYGVLASGLVDLVIQSFLGPYDFLAFIVHTNHRRCRWYYNRLERSKTLLGSFTIFRRSLILQYHCSRGCESSPTGFRVSK